MATRQCTYVGTEPFAWHIVRGRPPQLIGTSLRIKERPNDDVSGEGNIMYKSFHLWLPSQ